jgi:anti-anti-sigma factor
MKNSVALAPGSSTNEYTIQGELNFSTVEQLRAAGDDLLRTQATVIFNFQNITRSDSSVLALFTAWMRQARRYNKKIFFTHLSSQLSGIARLSELETILPLQSGEAQRG